MASVDFQTSMAGHEPDSSQQGDSLPASNAPGPTFTMGSPLANSRSFSGARVRMRKSPGPPAPHHGASQQPAAFQRSTSGIGRFRMPGSGAEATDLTSAPQPGSTLPTQGSGSSNNPPPLFSTDSQPQPETAPIFSIGSTQGTPSAKRGQQRTSGRTPPPKSRASSGASSSSGIGASSNGQLHSASSGNAPDFGTAPFSSADLNAKFQSLRPFGSAPAPASTNSAQPAQATNTAAWTKQQQPTGLQEQPGAAPIPSSPIPLEPAFSLGSAPVLGTPLSAGKQTRRRARMHQPPSPTAAATPEATTPAPALVPAIATPEASTPAPMAIPLPTFPGIGNMNATPAPDAQAPPSVRPTPASGPLPHFSPMMWSPQYAEDDQATPLPANAAAQRVNEASGAAGMGGGYTFTPMSASSQASDMSCFKATPPQQQQGVAQAGGAGLNPFSFPAATAGSGAGVQAPAWGNGFTSGAGAAGQNGWSWSLDGDAAGRPAAPAASAAAAVPAAPAAAKPAMPAMPAMPAESKEASTQRQSSFGAAAGPAAGTTAGSGFFASGGLFAPAPATGKAAAGGKVGPVSIDATNGVSSPPGNDTVQGKDTDRAQSGSAAAAAAAATQAQVVFSSMPQQPAAAWPSSGLFGTAGARPADSQPAASAFAFTAANPAPPAAPQAPAPPPAFVFSGAPPPAAAAAPAPAAQPPVDLQATLDQSSFSLGGAAAASMPSNINRHRVRLTKPAASRTTPPRQPVPPLPTATNTSNGIPEGTRPGPGAAPVHAAPSLTPEEAMAQRAEARAAKAQALKQQGNDLYAAQKYTESEAAYSAALEALATARPSHTDLAVLHSNRAGARLMIGKPVSALRDALRAISLDPKFFRAVSRVATCHCRMGDFTSAQRLLDKVLDRLSPSGPHFQELYKKLQEVERTRRDVEAASQVLTAATHGHAGMGSGGGGNGSGNGTEKLSAALAALEDLHPLVVYSEPMAAMRVTALLAMGRCMEAAAACTIAYQAPAPVSDAPWRMWLAMQAHYMAGDMQAALSKGAALTQALSNSNCLDKVAVAAAEGEATEFGGDSTVALAAAGLRLPSLQEVSAAASIAQQLLTLKEEGNAAIKAKQHQLAVDKYTAALALSPPPVFAAVLHSNRAAAHQGLGSVLDAVADCVRARALDRSFLKAFTRLASLLLEVRRPSAALEILEGVTKPGSGVTVSDSDRAGLASQVSAAKSAAAWQTTSDHYQLMGLERTCTEDEVRKAYRRAALKHHPDKAVSACRFSVCVPLTSGPAPPTSPPRGPGLPPATAAVPLVGAVAAIEARVKEEAAWMFNLVSQAHDELSDKSRRRKLDMLLEVEVPPQASYSSRGGAGGFGTSSFYQYDGFGSTFGSTFQPRTSSYSYRPQPQAGAGRAGAGGRGGAAGMGYGAGRGGAAGTGYGAGGGHQRTSSATGYGPGAGFHGAGSSYGPGSSYGRGGGGGGRNSTYQNPYGNPYKGATDFSAGESEDETSHY